MTEQWVVINGGVAALVLGFDRTGILVRPEKEITINPGDVVANRDFKLPAISCHQTSLGDWWVYFVKENGHE